jgi:hypothetical protein
VGFFIVIDWPKAFSAVLGQPADTSKSFAHTFASQKSRDRLYLAPPIGAPARRDSAFRIRHVSCEKNRSRGLVDDGEEKWLVRTNHVGNRWHGSPAQVV